MMKLTRKQLMATAGAAALVAAGVAIPAITAQAATPRADTYYASVGPTGTLVKGFGPAGPVTSVLLPPPFGPGDYRVVIPGITATACVTLANTNNDSADVATAIPSGGGVIIVHTFSAAAVPVPASKPFDLVVVC